MKLKDIITEEVSKKSAGGTYDDLESPLVEPGTLLDLKHVSVENRTTAFTRLIIGVADGTNFSYKEDQEDPQPNTLYWTSSRIQIPEGKKLRARLTGCTNGDNLHLTYEGHLLELP